MRPSNDVIIRTAILAVTWINMILSAKGISPLPFTDDQLGQGVSTGLALAATVWAWWRNNSFTKAAQEGDKVTRALKAGEGKHRAGGDA